MGFNGIYKLTHSRVFTLLHCGKPQLGLSFYQEQLAEGIYTGSQWCGNRLEVINVGALAETRHFSDDLTEYG